VRRTVHVETSVFSYLAGRPSRDLIVAARQQRTHTWWRTRRAAFDLYVSQVVIDEVGAGDPGLATRRSGFLAGVPTLDMSGGVADLAAALVKGVPPSMQGSSRCGAYRGGGVPSDRFPADVELGSHCEAELRPRIEAVCRASRYSAPILCTPDELMGEES